MADGQFSHANIIKKPAELPPHTPIRIVRLRGRGKKVAAALASTDGEILTELGTPVRYTAGDHYLVERPSGRRDVIRRDIFERTHRKIGESLYRENDDIRYRAAIAKTELNIATDDGVRTAREGDWVMIGVADEMWPLPADQAKRKYKGVPAVGITGVVTTIGLVFALLAFVAWYAS
jgi:hypothetical protein